MNKRFFNQQNLTRRLRMLPVLFAMLLMPFSAWAQDESYFGINIDTSENGIWVTDANASNILGDGTMSYNVTNNILTLNGINLSFTSDYFSDAFIAMVDEDHPTLTVHLVGDNILTLGEKACVFNGWGITFTTDTSNPGTLTINTGDNWGGALFIDNPSHDPINATYNNGLSLSQNGNTYTIQASQTNYGLTVGGVEVTPDNASDITGTGITAGTVSFTPAGDTTPATLTLEGANLTEGITTSINGLVIDLIGDNTITSSTQAPIKGTGDTEPTLTLKSSGTTVGSLKLILTEASGYSETQNATLSLENPLVRCDDGNNVYFEEGYQLIVGDIQMSKHQDIAGKIGGISANNAYNHETNTLTLDGWHNDNASIVSGLPVLNIKLMGSSSFSYIMANTDIEGTKTLVFQTEDSESVLALAEAISGFNNVTYQNNLVFRTIIGDAGETFSVETISKPTMTGDGNNVTFTFNAGLELHYSIDYAKEGVADVTDATISTSGTSVALSGPCTVTAYTKWNNSQSDEVVGKLFGFATESVSGYAGQGSIPFSLVPAINVATDGLTLGTQTGNENIVAAVNDAYDTIILGEGLGLTFFRVTMKAGAETPYTILNYIYEGTANIGPLDVKVSVAEPTVSPDATGGPFNIGQLVTLGYEYEPSNDVHSIKYIVGEDLTVAPTTYTAPFALNETAAVNAWVETTYSGNKYSSDTVTVNYAIKQDPKLKVSYTWYRLRFGETFSQEVTSDMPTTPTVTWSSSNTDVATVDPTTGVVTPVAAYGSDIEITATFAGDDTWSAASVSYAIRVDKAEQYLRIKYKGTNIPLSTVKVEKGNPIDIKTEYDFSCPEELVGSLVWYSNDENVVTVTNGVVTTVGCGSTWIKVSSAGNSNYESDYCDFTIEVAPPKPTINLAEGTYLSTHAPITITKENIANTTISYTWDDLTGNNDAEWKNYTDAGVTIQEGTLSARVGYYDAENYNTIYSDTVSVAYTVIIDPELQFIQNDEPVDAAVYTIGATNNLELPVLDNTYGVAVTYESSNTDVATVATDGTVTAVGIGTATITATSAATSEYAAGEASYTLTVKRQLNVSFSTSNDWATYCGTENLSKPEGLKAYQVTAVEGATVTISEIGYIPANTAVLLQNVSNNNTWSNIPASAYTGATSTFASNKLIGTASDVDVSTISGGTVYVLYNNMFKRATGGTIPANRGYLVVEPSVVNVGSGAPELSISIGDENTTAINEHESHELNELSGEWYSIDGVKLNGQPQKPGLYIKNGKKVFINKK